MIWSVAHVTSVLCLSLAACGFQPNPGTTSKPIDAPPEMGMIDAPDSIIHDAPKVFMDAPAVAGSLSLSASTLGSGTIDLTAEGTRDWAHWGYLMTSGFDQKSNGTGISNLETAPEFSFTGSPFTASWSNGAPHLAVTGTTSGVGVTSPASMSFTVAADTTPRTLRLYAGVQAASARLDLMLSDGSAPAIMATLTDASTTNDRYTITFNAASAGNTLRVTWTDTNDFGGGGSFAALLEATLQ